MNLEKLATLANWLDDGAPHVVFDMDIPNELIGDAAIYRDPETIERYEIEAKQKNLGDCGTVCCIAGYAVHLAGEAGEKDSSWDDVQSKALSILGLTTDGEDHPLFNPLLAPENCTPQEAAVAVRNVMEGKHPWKD